jgi:CheY-like chemotaxis protein
MPRMNGSELAAKIGQHYPHIPMLFMSGYSGDDILQRGLSLAAAVHNRLEQARELLGDRAASP